MTGVVPREDQMPKRLGRFGGVLHFGGARYWTASLLPALVGTTLPLWLRPPGFAFRWLGAGEFLLSVLLMHAGFSFLLAWSAKRSTAVWPGSRLLRYAGVCILSACLLGVHLNSNLHLHRFVQEYIFIIYGLCVVFVGTLYVLPPFSFWRRAGGEIVIAEGLGLLPLLGAYLVQVGDITRKVYLASIPLVIATALWIWTDQIASRVDDEKAGRRTMLSLFSAAFSGSWIVLVLVILLYASLFGAAFVSTVNPWTLIAVVAAGLAFAIVKTSWREFSNSVRMLEVERRAFRLHLITGVILAAASLMALAG